MAQSYEVQERTETFNEGKMGIEIATWYYLRRGVNLRIEVRKKVGSARFNQTSSRDIQ